MKEKLDNLVKTFEALGRYCQVEALTGRVRQ